MNEVLESIDNFLISPLGISIVGGLIVILLGYYVFGIGRSKKGTEIKSEKTTKDVNLKGDNNIIGNDIVVTNVYEQDFNRQEIVSTQPKLSSLSPVAMINEVKTRPMLQKEEAHDAYIGRKITWKVILYAIRAYDDIYRLSCYPPDSLLTPCIFCDVKKQDYPILKSIHQNETLYIKGTIASFEGINVEIQDAELIFIEG